MRVLSFLVAGALVAASGAAVAAPASHHHAKPKPDLYVPAMTASYAGGSVTAAVYVTNKGKAKAGPSIARVYLSTDAAVGAGDVVLGDLPIKKLRPHKTDYPIVPLAVPGSVPPGTYHVLACADGAKKVKEKKENNNCGGAPTTVTITSPPPPPPPGTVAVSWDVYLAYGTVQATTSAGTCTSATPTTSGSCTVPTGAATVTLVAERASSSFFWHTGQGWLGSTCDGAVSGESSSGATMTFNNPSADKACEVYFYSVP